MVWKLMIRSKGITKRTQSKELGLSGLPLAGAVYGVL